MTTITLCKNESTYSIEAKGHTEGRVCSAISMMLYTVAGFVDNDPFIKVYESTLAPGDSMIKWSGGISARGAYEMAKIGLLQLEAGYPEHLKVGVNLEPSL